MPADGRWDLTLRLKCSHWFSKSCFEHILLTQNLMSPSMPCFRFVARNIPKWRGRGHFCKITGQTFRQIVPHFSARISGVLADVEAPGNESGNH